MTHTIEIVSGLSLSNAIFIQMFFIKYGYYPVVYMQKWITDVFYPVWIDERTYFFIRRLLPGIQEYLIKVQEYSIDTWNTTFEYFTTRNLLEFLISFFLEKDVSLHSYMSTLAGVTYDGETFPSLLPLLQRIHGDNIHITTHKPLFPDYVSTVWTSYLQRTVEIFTTPVKYFTGVSNTLYASRSQDMSSYFKLLQLQDTLYFVVDYENGFREVALHEGIWLFSHYFESSVPMTESSLSTSIKIDIQLTLHMPYSSRLCFLWNALGYIPPIKWMGTFISIFDSYFALYGSYREILMYRTEFYKVLSYIFTHKGVERNIVLDRFLAKNSQLNFDFLFNKLKI